MAKPAAGRPLIVGPRDAADALTPSDPPAADGASGSQAGDGSRPDAALRPDGQGAGPGGRAEARAIFVVGVSRSGTTLMRNVLNSHSRVAIAGENHFLGHLLPWEGARHAFRRFGDLDDDATIRRLVEYIYSGAFSRRSRLREPSPFWIWLVRKVPRDELEARLLAGERTERGVFTALLRAFADQRGKAIIGEKTPAHVAWAETLLEWYRTAGSSR